MKYFVRDANGTPLHIKEPGKLEEFLDSLDPSLMERITLWTMANQHKRSLQTKEQLTDLRMLVQYGREDPSVIKQFYEKAFESGALNREMMTSRNERELLKEMGL